jgi:pimeloyl-ACP methyl ester carboxylesterase
MITLNFQKIEKGKSKKKSVLKIVLTSFVSMILIATGLMVWFICSLFAEPDLSKLPSYHPFKSQKAKVQYLSYYDSRAKQWPVASECRYIETSYGQTFVRISGPEGAPSLVLLPSANASSLIWLSNIKALSESFRVYAVDNIYDVGRSVYSRPFKRPDDFTRWLDDLFTGLALGDSVNLMGYSYGGWISSQYALRHPERLRKVVMIAPPATIINLPGEWAWRAILSVIPHKYFMKKLLVDWMFEDLANRKDEYSKGKIDDLLTDAIMVLKCYKMKMMVSPTVLSDEELRSIKIPALFLVGEHEKIYSAVDAVKRIHFIAPQIKTEIVRNASHDLPISQREYFNKRVIEFLKQSQGD